jgi:hypothetical protein
VILEPHNGSAPECSCETDVEQQEVKSIMMNTEKKMVHILDERYEK